MVLDCIGLLLLNKVHFRIIFALEFGVGGIVVRRGKGVLLLRGARVVKGTSFSQGGLHWVKVSQSQ